MDWSTCHPVTRDARELSKDFIPCTCRSVTTLFRLLVRWKLQLVIIAGTVFTEQSDIIYALITVA